MFSFCRTRAVLKELEALLRCNSCDSLLEKPCCLGVCDHLFCKGCVQNYAGNECPVCRVPCHARDVQPDRQLDDLLSRFRQMAAVIYSSDSSTLEGSASASHSFEGVPNTVVERESSVPRSLRPNYDHVSGDASLATSASVDGTGVRDRRERRIADEELDVHHTLGSTRCRSSDGDTRDHRSPSPEIFSQAITSRSDHTEYNYVDEPAAAARVMPCSTKSNEYGTEDKIVKADGEVCEEDRNHNTSKAEDDDTEILATPQAEQLTAVRFIGSCKGIAYGAPSSEHSNKDGQVASAFATPNNVIAAEPAAASLEQLPRGQADSGDGALKAIQANVVILSPSFPADERRNLTSMSTAVFEEHTSITSCPVKSPTGARPASHECKEVETFAAAAPKSTEISEKDRAPACAGIDNPSKGDAKGLRLMDTSPVDTFRSCAKIDASLMTSEQPSAIGSLDGSYVFAEGSTVALLNLSTTTSSDIESATSDACRLLITEQHTRDESLARSPISKESPRTKEIVTCDATAAPTSLTSAPAAAVPTAAALCAASCQQVYAAAEPVLSSDNEFALLIEDEAREMDTVERASDSNRAAVKTCHDIESRLRIDTLETAANSSIASVKTCHDSESRSAIDSLSVYDFVPSQDDVSQKQATKRPAAKTGVRGVLRWCKKRSPLLARDYNRSPKKSRCAAQASAAAAIEAFETSFHNARVAVSGASAVADPDALLSASSESNSRSSHARVSVSPNGREKNRIKNVHDDSTAPAADGSLASSNAIVSTSHSSGSKAGTEKVLLSKKSVRFAPLPARYADAVGMENKSSVRSKDVGTEAAASQRLQKNATDQGPPGKLRRIGAVGPKAVHAPTLERPVSGIKQAAPLCTGSKSASGVIRKSGLGIRQKTVVNIDKRNAKGETLLHTASIKGDCDAVEALLRKGADANAKDNAGWTPLHEAAIHGHVDVLRLLLDRGAHVNVPGADNDTPLHDAVASGHIACAKLLIERGASATQHNARGVAAIDLATTPEIKSLLLRGADDEQYTGSSKATVAKTRRRSLQSASAASSGIAEAAVSVIQPKAISRYVLLSTSLKREQRAVVAKCAALLRGSCADELSPEVTHVVTATNAAGLCPRTMKFLLSILAGKWIVCYDWAKTCVERGRYVGEERYEVKGCSASMHLGAPNRARLSSQLQQPKLFDGCSFYFVGPFLYPTPCKEELAALVTAGGGQVVQREPRRLPNADPAAAGDGGSTEGHKACHVPYHALPGTLPYARPFFYVYDPRRCASPPDAALAAAGRLADGSNEAVTAPAGWCLAAAGWLLDCVANFRLLDVVT